jgi:hypothetical protein
METKEPKDELTKIKTALWINTMATVFTLAGLIFSINSGVTLRIVFSSLSFVAFTALSLTIFLRLIKLQKQ